MTKASKPTKCNRHLGSALDDVLAKRGMLEEVKIAAVAVATHLLREVVIHRKTKGMRASRLRIQRQITHEALLTMRRTK